jgi:hypothetical protein
MFKVGDKIIRVKHVRTTFRLMSWKLNVWNFWVLQNNMDDMDFIVFFYEAMGSINLLMQKYKSWFLGRWNKGRWQVVTGWMNYFGKGVWRCGRLDLMIGKNSGS